MAEVVDVYVAPGWSYAGNHHYDVFVNGVKYDEFTSRKGWLTMAEMNDVASYYAEALTGRDLPARL